MGFRINEKDITTNYTRTISEFITGLTYENIPEDVRERAKHLTMHTIGVSLSAHGLPISDKAIAIAKSCGTGEPYATIWGDGSKVSMSSAAFANGTLADVMDWEDCAWTGHPSAGVIPVAWAVAEALHLSGREFLTAVVAAYEIYQRIAMVVQPPKDWDIMKGWGLTSWQIFAAVVPAAKLMGLTAEQVNQALGFGVLCCPIQSNLHHITMSDAYHFEHGFRAKDGVLAAMVAEKGVDNYMDCFDDTYTFDYHMTPEPKREWYTKELGTRWLTKEVLVKHWPANMWLQTPIELAHDITVKYHIKPEDIEEVILDPPTVGRMYYSPEGFNSLTQAQFSAPFMLAAYLLNPLPGPGWFDRSKLTDPDILQLAGRIHGGDSKPHYLNQCFKGFQKGDFPMKTLTIKTKDGKVYEASMDCHPGHPKNMMSHEEFVNRFKVEAAPTLSAKQLETVSDALAGLETCRDIAEISKMLCKQGNCN